jgi:hypothetical protein
MLESSSRSRAGSKSCGSKPARSTLRRASTLSRMNLGVCRGRNEGSYLRVRLLDAWHVCKPQAGPASRGAPCGPRVDSRTAARPEEVPRRGSLPEIEGIRGAVGSLLASRMRSASWTNPRSYSNGAGCWCIWETALSPRGLISSRICRKPRPSSRKEIGARTGDP